MVSQAWLAVCRGNEMGKINKAMLMLIAMLAIMITAVGIDRAVNIQARKDGRKNGGNAMSRPGRMLRRFR